MEKHRIGVNPRRQTEKPAKIHACTLTEFVLNVQAAIRLLTAGDKLRDRWLLESRFIGDQHTSMPGTALVMVLFVREARNASHQLKSYDTKDPYEENVH